MGDEINTAKEAVGDRLHGMQWKQGGYYFQIHWEEGEIPSVTFTTAEQEEIREVKLSEIVG